MSAVERLALRALGAPSQVRPRLGGLFEREPTGRDGGEAAALATPPPPEVAISGTAPPTSRAASRLAEVSPPAPPRDRTGPDPSAPATRERAPARSGDEPPAAQAGGPIFAPIVERSIREPSQVERVDASGPPPPAPQAYRPLMPERMAPPPPVTPLGSRSEPTGPAPADIQISIGRIEVRGEPERRRPSPPPRRAPQLMSLEDYLAKGRRR